MNKKKLASALMTGVLTIALTGQALSAPIEYGEELKNAPQSTPYVTFTDLPQTYWAYNYIANMVQKKVIEGYVDNKFRPENTITRAEFATIIVKASGIKPAKVNYASFSDVPVSNWASPFVESVKDYMTGYRLANSQYNFNPDTPATREDITVAIVRLKGYDTRLANRAAVEPMFKDFESISESAKDYVAIAVKEGLVSGYPDETFRGQATITRAEASALLYRAFLYGNDNKGVGGQGGSSTTPTAPVTQPSTNPQPAPKTTTPTTTNQSQQPSQAAKFSVDTLVGGTGTGDVDGPVYQAKINQVDNMVVDKDDNVYVLDSSKKKIRKFNKSNGTLETFKTIDSQFNWEYSQEGKNVIHFDYTKFQPTRLAYNITSNKLYLMGITKSSDREYRYHRNIFEISPSVHSVVYKLNSIETSTSGWISDYSNFVAFSDPNTMFFKEIGFGDFIYKSSLDSHTSDVIASRNDKTGVDLSGVAEGIITETDIFTFGTGNNTLSKVHLFPRQVETIKTIGNIEFDTISTNKGKFYISSGTTIYELTTDGKLTTFIDGKDLTYNDGIPIKKISQLSFDSQGNIIVYDDENKAIRRINL
ncbi:S-layer homology domain-containing protein [Paenibacillus thalictri]|nr:S-layer homology domain-containing protein [Paenibacillus thalictri]